MTKLFLVEDDRTMLSLLKTLLEMDGFVTIPLDQNHPDTILSQIESSSPDLVIMDYYLHDDNGITVIKKMKEIESLASLPIIMTSGSDVRDICLESGADAFIMKPYMPSDLTDLINNTLENYRKSIME